MMPTVDSTTRRGAGAVARYVHTDHLTGSNVVTNASGSQEELLDYYPYGTMRLDQKAGSYSEQKKFAGLMYDAGTGLSYAGARYYDSSIGRFLSQDPVSSLTPEACLDDPQRFNTYSYARNNPLNNVDPTGLYDTKTGEIQDGDSTDSITNDVNKAFGITTDWATIANVSFFNDNYGTTDPAKLVGQRTWVGTDHVADITDRLHYYNESRAGVAEKLGPSSLMMFAPHGPWDLKNSNDSVLGVTNESNNYFAFIYEGGLIRYDAPGNINYGYVAKASGVGSAVIRAGATAAQIVDNLRRGQFSASDNSGDAAYVQQGSSSYNGKGAWWQRVLNLVW